MKILVISHEYPPIGGGGANACGFLCDMLSEHGHEGVILTSAYNGLPRKEMRGSFCIIRVPAVRKRVEKSSFFEMFSFLCSAWIWAERNVKKNDFSLRKDAIIEVVTKNALNKVPKNIEVINQSIDISDTEKGKIVTCYIETIQSFS